jgi:radical SAM family uncharacterized protein/radical SAM-linked protein
MTASTGMRRLLPLIPKPSHYAGCEIGAVRKAPDAVKGRIALAFPDLYEVGMSYTGQTLLYHAVNQRPELWAERVFAPGLEAAEILRAQGGVLSTLESDTPLASLDALGFHLTHELCYTNVLYMLDLAGLPLRSKDRDPDLPLRGPLVIAGGGCAFNAEPLTPFLDALILGDGEEILPELLERLVKLKTRGLSKTSVLRELSRTPGVYVPSFFRDKGPGQPLEPLFEDYTRVEKRLLPDLDKTPYPTRPTQAFDAVHDRYAIEIARGCTRGCRFCQAGMIYRPVRERSLSALDAILERGLSDSGYGEVSFLALSAGDFSGLSALFSQSLSRCQREQVAISLPSLRVGSISPEIMAKIAGIRRTGATVAPEAGSQRLRDVINKGVTEPELLEHAAALARNGWQNVKLYFMIGLPTESYEDLDAILDLCLAVERASKEAGYRLNVTAAISPFVPKAHTPFQWEPQIGLSEIEERVAYLRTSFRPHKRLRLRWHLPEMSFLEGVFARGDRRLADLVEDAYRRGALFSSWNDKLDLATWREAMTARGIDPAEYLAERPMDAALPWDHLTSGVSKAYLRGERIRGLKLLTTEDCRFGECRGCGVCTLDGRPSELRAQAAGMEIRQKLNFIARDQLPVETPTEANVSEPRAILPAQPARPGAKRRPPARAQELGVKAAHFRIWHHKREAAAYLSQLELQTVFERAFRRAKLPLTFSQGFHPLPLVSFTRALPVSVESEAEYFDVFLRESWNAAAVRAALDGELPAGLEVRIVQELPLSGRHPQAEAEIYRLECLNLPRAQAFAEAWKQFLRVDCFEWTRETKKGARTLDIRPMVQPLASEDERPEVVRFSLDWRQCYVSPLALVLAALRDFSTAEIRLRKLEQLFPSL